MQRATVGEVFDEIRSYLPDDRTFGETVDPAGWDRIDAESRAEQVAAHRSGRVRVA